MSTLISKNTCKANSLRLILLLGLGIFFNSQVFSQTYDVTFTLTPDCWGNETSWTLTDSGNNPIGSGAEGDYTTGFPNGPGDYTEAFTMSSGECYTFIINDSYGDGMYGSQWGSCSVDGTFTFISDTGDVISELTVADFGSSATYNFCITSGCTDSNASNYNSNATINDGSCIYAPPVASFSYSLDNSECGNATVQFTNTSTDATSYSWTFQNGTPSTSSEENPIISFPTGANFEAILTATNSNGDNSAIQAVSIPFDEEGTIITLVMSPDCWGTETSWTLLDSDNNVVSSIEQGYYPDNFPDNAVFTHSFCLSNGCYNFTIDDSYGDGFEGEPYWSCDVNGDYHFEDTDGNVLSSFAGDPNFGDSYSDAPCFNQLYVWTGAFDTDWTNTGNWQGGIVPGQSNNVLIQTINNDPIIAGSKKVNKIVIDNNSSVSFVNSSANLKVHGDFVNFGELDLFQGKIIMKGSSTSYIKSDITPNFYHLKIQKNDSVKLLTDVNFRGALMPTSGVFDFNGKQVTLLSDETYTGSIGEIKSNADVVGDVITLNRYFPAAGGSWRMVCTSITDATFEQWNDDIPTTGFTGSDYPNYPSANNPWSNIRGYDETLFAGQAADLDSGFVSVSNITDVIGNDGGYLVYFSPSPTTLDVNGTWARDQQQQMLDFTESNSIDFNDGWNLMANPYPSAIDWDASSGWTKTDLNDAIYAYDPINGQYSSYVNGISVGSMTNEIASSQAFWVKSEAGSPAITFNESVKTNAVGVHLKSSDFNTQTVVRIKVESDGSWDETVLGINTTASDEFDGGLDAYKFWSSNPSLPNLASITNEDTLELSINMIPVPEEDVSIDLLLKKGSHTEFIMSNEMMDSYDENICLILEDKELNVYSPFNLGDSYEFMMSDESLETRFALHMSAPLTSAKTNESCPELDDGTITVDGFGEAPWTFTWFDQDGILVQETTGATTADNMFGLTPGFYEIIVTNSSSQCNSASKVIEVESAPTGSISSVVESTVCQGENNGIIEVNVSDFYYWDVILLDGNEQEVVQVAGTNEDVVFTNLSADVYSINAIDQCGHEMEEVNIDLVNPMSVSTTFFAQPDSLNLFYGGNVSFSNYSTGALGFIWNFDDGTIDSLSVDAEHIFNAPGTYEVNLWAGNMSCSNTMSKTVQVYYLESSDNNESEEETSTGVGEIDWTNAFTTNYDAEKITIFSNQQLDEEVIFQLFNSNGQLVVENKLESLRSQAFEIGISHLAQGVFYLNVSSSNTILHTEKIIKDR